MASVNPIGQPQTYQIQLKGENTPNPAEQVGKAGDVDQVDTVELTTNSGETPNVDPNGQEPDRWMGLKKLGQTIWNGLKKAWNWLWNGNEK